MHEKWIWKHVLKNLRLNEKFIVNLKKKLNWKLKMACVIQLHIFHSLGCMFSHSTY